MPFFNLRNGFFVYLNMNKLFETYLNKQQFNKVLIDSPANKKLELIVIIPAFNEPNILNTLNSLLSCNTTLSCCEVIVLLNNAETTPESIKEQNHQTYSLVNNWINKNASTKLKFHCVYVKNLPKKHAGAGLARKLAMDEAIRRFNSIENLHGIICSLDADTTVSTNYFTETIKSFKKNKKQNCTVFQFEHKIGENCPKEQKRAIILYEMYLRYFKLALSYSGYPYSFHTIGSCFAVRADTYVKQGGMNRKQAGEDFYFLNKIFPLGGTFELNSVCVYPSSRISDRVPFGTGPALAKIINDNDFYTYTPIYFNYLKAFFNEVDGLYKASREVTNQFYNDHLHSSIQKFIKPTEFNNRISEINQNASALTTFKNRFFNWFDAFKIIKYLNFTHLHEERIPICNATKLFLEMNNINSKYKNEMELLSAIKNEDINGLKVNHSPQQ